MPKKQIIERKTQYFFLLSMVWIFFIFLIIFYIFSIQKDNLEDVKDRQIKLFASTVSLMLQNGEKELLNSYIHKLKHHGVRYVAVHDNHNQIIIQDGSVVDESIYSENLSISGNLIGSLKIAYDSEVIDIWTLRLLILIIISLFLLFLILFFVNSLMQNDQYNLNQIKNWLFNPSLEFQLKKPNKDIKEIFDLIQERKFNSQLFSENFLVFLTVKIQDFQILNNLTKEKLFSVIDRYRNGLDNISSWAFSHLLQQEDGTSIFYFNSKNLESIKQSLVIFELISNLRSDIEKDIFPVSFDVNFSISCIDNKFSLNEETLENRSEVLSSKKISKKDVNCLICNKFFSNFLIKYADLTSIGDDVWKVNFIKIDLSEDVNKLSEFL